MKRDYPVLAQRQANLLQEIHGLGLMTDLSLAAAVVGAGESPIDRSNFVRWRKGECCAPLGLLPVILDHAGDKAQEILNVLAEPLGFQCVPLGGIDMEPRSLTDRTMEITELTGRLAATVRASMLDGHLDATEAERIRAVTAELRRMVVSLETLSGDVAAELVNK